MPKVYEIYVPQMFSLAEDYDIHRGYSVIDSGAYSPLSYVHGEVCEPCWLTRKARWLGEAWADWGDYEELIGGVGDFDCPHGGAS